MRMKTPLRRELPPNQSTAHAGHSYLLADSLVPYTSILGGILACKVGFSYCIIEVAQIEAYAMHNLFSTLYFRSYEGLTKIQRLEWNNRSVCGRSICWPVTFRSSLLSTFALGVTVGYFIADLGLLLWFYSSLGGKEFVLHHSLSGIAVAYAILSGEGQLYTFMILISEVTTPEINMRWFLDTAGLKRSAAYLINGVMIFLAWLVARILLFVYMFYHVYLHLDQVIQMHPFGFLFVFVVPSILAAMNMMWFGKIVKGLVKTLMKKP